MWPFKKLFRKRSIFTPVESKVLMALGENLSPQWREVSHNQLSQVNQVQRHGEGREVCCYAVRNGKVSWDNKSLFEMISREAQIATIRVTHADSGRNWSVAVVIVDGHLFSLEFDKKPDHSLELDELNVTSVEIDASSIQTNDADSESRIPTVQEGLSGWVLEWHQFHRLDGLRSPQSPESITRTLKQLNSAFPPDYLSLIDQTDGCSVGDCAILGVSEVYQVVLPDANYTVLAQRPNVGALGVRVGSSEGALYYLDYEGSSPQQITASFQNAVEQLLAM